MNPDQAQKETCERELFWWCFVALSPLTLPSLYIRSCPRPVSCTLVTTVLWTIHTRFFRTFSTQIRNQDLPKVRTGRAHEIKWKAVGSEKPLAA